MQPGGCERFNYYTCGDYAQVLRFSPATLLAHLRPRARLAETLMVAAPSTLGTVKDMALSSGPDNSSPVGADTSLGDPARSERRRGTIDLVVTVVVAVLLAALVRLFVAQVFVIPSESMYPTLQEADRVLVEKVSPHVSGVGRGEVVVFDRPAALDHLGVEAYLIKRVIGLPGETISASEGVVHIDGEPLTEPWLADVETGYFPEVKIPEGHYFMMGDNRSGSEDSRSFGPVPHEDVVGQALILMWPLSRVEPL